MKAAAKVVKATIAPRKRVAARQPAGLTTMHQGSTGGRKGDADKAGKVVQIMRNGGKSPSAPLPTGLRQTMRQGGK